jgi:hypothetical protein
MSRDADMPEENQGFDEWYKRRAQLPAVRKYRHEAMYRMAFLPAVGFPLVGICALLHLRGTIFWVVICVGITIGQGLAIYLARREWSKAEKSN